MTTNGIYHTLVTQLDKLARHNRQGSFRRVPEALIWIW